MTEGKETTTARQYLYVEEQHANSTLSRLNDLRNERGSLCDVSIATESEDSASVGRRIFAHRAVLAASSPYFKAMFTADMLESRSSVVKIHGVEADTLAALIDFAYTGSIRVTANNVRSLLAGASLVQMTNVRQACVDFLNSSLRPSTCLGIQALADTYTCSDLLRLADEYIYQHFGEVASTDEYLRLSTDRLLSLLQREELRVRSEEQVFEAAMRWVRADLDEREQWLPDALSKVRLPLLSPQYLLDRVAPDPLIRGDLRCRDLLDEAKDYHLVPERRARMQTPRTVPRRCSKENGLIYAVGGLSPSGESMNCVERLDPLDAEWTLVASMHSMRSRVGVAVLNGKLYAIGGYDGGQRLNSMECFDPATGKWKTMASMHTRRSAVAAAAMNDRIFVVGGYDGTASLSSVEVYDVKTDRWKFVAGMSTSRSAAGAGVFLGQLHVLGGHDGLSIFNSVEQYDAKHNQWKPAPSMQTKRCRLGVAVLNKRLFAVGGYDGSSFLNTVEVYDSKSRVWMPLSPMTTRRSRVGVAVLGNRIYAVGGYNGLSNLNSVEVYDKECHEWRLEAPMVYHQGGVGVAVLPRTFFEKKS